MNIYGKIEHSKVNGPGDRAVIWVQGCTLGCSGCWNPETHQHGIGQKVLVRRGLWPDELVSWLMKIEDIEGVTFSGGEPMQQAPDLLSVMREVRRWAPHLSIGMFTGYSLEELETRPFKWYDGDHGFGTSGRGLWDSIRDLLDFAVMGRFNRLQRDHTEPMCSSRNQQLYLFSPFYKREDFQPQSYEVTISGDGKLVNITGFPKNAAAVVQELCY